MFVIMCQNPFYSFSALRNTYLSPDGSSSSTIGSPLLKHFTSPMFIEVIHFLYSILFFFLQSRERYILEDEVRQLKARLQTLRERAEQHSAENALRLEANSKILASYVCFVCFFILYSCSERSVIVTLTCRLKESEERVRQVEQQVCVLFITILFICICS
jgi:hypothetical protein